MWQRKKMRLGGWDLHLSCWVDALESTEVTPVSLYSSSRLRSIKRLHTLQWVTDSMFQCQESWLHM